MLVLNPALGTRHWINSIVRDETLTSFWPNWLWTTMQWMSMVVSLRSGWPIISSMVRRYFSNGSVWIKQQHVWPKLRWSDLLFRCNRRVHWFSTTPKWMFNKPQQNLRTINEVLKPSRVRPVSRPNALRRSMSHRWMHRSVSERIFRSTFECIDWS